MLENTHRFHGHGRLRYVYKNGNVIRSHLITIKTTKNKRRSHSRFAVVISKKVHKSAVGRNRMRRRIYEIIRAELPKFDPAHDVAVMVFSSEVLFLESEELRKTITVLFSRADLYK